MRSGYGELRRGYTTGTCAACAAGAAASVLLGNTDAPEWGEVPLPNGGKARIAIVWTGGGDDWAACAVVKDAGDDPDVTDGSLVYASVKRAEKEILNAYVWERQGARLYLEGGEGVGVVTKPGLSCPVGMAAINPVPRRMIFEAVDRERRTAGYAGDLSVRVSIPDGKRLAAKTFNPKLGIEGGISILGTTGVVEPMSETAVLQTIRLEIHMRAVEGVRRMILTPGNYGEAFLKDKLGLSLEQGVQCSNFIADTVEMACDEGMEELLLAGHVGKLIKVTGGVRNTHSKYGDRRMELLWDCIDRGDQDGAVSAGKEEVRRRILACNTTEEAAGVMTGLGIAEAVMDEIANKVRLQLETWAKERLKAECVVFTGKGELFGMSSGAQKLIRKLR